MLAIISKTKGIYIVGERTHITRDGDAIYIRYADSDYSDLTLRFATAEQAELGFSDIIRNLAATAGTAYLNDV